MHNKNIGQKMFSIKTIALSLILAFGPGLNSALASEKELCARSPDEAATRFATLAVMDARSTTPLVRKTSLHQYRARLEQIVDDRYSPDSRPFRDRLLGTDWNQKRMRESPDELLVGQFLAGGESLRKNWRISDVTVIQSKKSIYSGHDVTVRYRIETPSGGSFQEREFSAYVSGECWQVDMPVAAWARLDQLAEILKKSRSENLMARQGPPRVRLQIAAASDRPQIGMRELSRSGVTGKVWVATTPLLTEGHVDSAEAVWDCDTGLGPEDPAVSMVFNDEGAQLLRRWTSGNIGSMLAVVANEQVVVFARISAAVGPRLNVCFRDCLNFRV